MLLAPSNEGHTIVVESMPLVPRIETMLSVTVSADVSVRGCNSRKHSIVHPAVVRYLKQTETSDQFLMSVASSAISDSTGEDESSLTHLSSKKFPIACTVCNKVATDWLLRICMLPFHHAALAILLGV